MEVFEGDAYLVHVAGGEVALAVLSGLLVFAAIAAVRLARRQVNMTAAVPALGFVFWWVFIWLTPQVYYLLYVTLAEGLPLAFVIGWPPGPARLMELLTFRARDSAADVALGMLGWTMIAVSVPRS